MDHTYGHKTIKYYGGISCVISERNYFTQNTIGDHITLFYEEISNSGLSVKCCM